MQDIGPPAGILVENVEECQAECDALAECNAASYYIELIEDTQTNCFLKKIGEACMVPGDAIQDDNAVLSLKCEDDQAMAPMADAPMMAGAPLAADAPAAGDDATGGADGATTRDVDPGAGDDTADDEVADEGSGAGSLGVSVAAAAIAAVAALI